MSERTEVQNPLIRYAAEIGWEPLSQTEALTRRGGEAGLFFGELLGEQLRKLNPYLTFDPQAVLRELENLRIGIGGNHDLLLYLRGQKSVYDPAQKREFNLTLIDFEQLENNCFHVTDEWEYTNGRYTNRSHSARVKQWWANHQIAMPKKKPSDELISLVEAENRYGFKAGYLRNLASRGRLKAKKMGRDWFTTPADVEEYIQSRQHRGVFRTDIEQSDS